ncbi:MAG: molybdopterin-synthase adenylyltransferase MoeB [Pseudomonadota bacterium]
MMLFIGLSVAIWFIGRAMKVPRNARWIMIGLLYLAILAATILLRDRVDVTQMLGGSTAEWFAIGVIGAIIWAYTQGLKKLRARVRPENRAPDEDTRPSSTELERNARHIVLREIGGPGQKRLKDAKVLVIGAGGLGSPALQYLASAGVGTIGVIDDDLVENSNLQRQVIHTDARIGMPKVFSAELAMKAQNPFVTVRPYNRRLTADIAEDLFADYDLILDGCDDTETRYVANAAAYAVRKPLISGALSQWEGQVTVFAPWEGTPCYRCVFPNPNATGLAPSCAEGGVLSALPGVVGTIMAVEAIKEITGAGDTLRGRMMIYDALYGETRIIALKKDPACPICGSG